MDFFFFLTLGEQIIFFILLSILIVMTFFYSYCKFQGDENFTILTEQTSLLEKKILSSKKASFIFKIPYFNFGKQDAIILDVFPRILLPQEQFGQAIVTAKLEDSNSRRDDYYMEALPVLLLEGGDFYLTIDIESTENNIATVLTNMVDVPIAFYYEVLGRCHLKYRKHNFIFRDEYFTAN